MNRKEFLKKSAKALVATAFLQFPAKILLAGEKTKYYKVFSRTEKLEDLNLNRVFYVYIENFTWYEGMEVKVVIFDNVSGGDSASPVEVGTITYECTELTRNETDNIPLMQLKNRGIDYVNKPDYKKGEFKYFSSLTFVKSSSDGDSIILQSKSSDDIKELSHTYNYNSETQKLDAVSTYDDYYMPGCFLTSACVFARGLEDDCYELTTLRHFRDNFMRTHAEGNELIQYYYKHAPKIVEQIEERANKKAIYDYIYTSLVLPSIALINQKQDELAMEYYAAFTLRLSKEMNLA